MEDVDAIENGYFVDEMSKPNVILKNGFQVEELNDGLDIEVKEKYQESDDEKECFFDSEEVFHQLNYECVGFHNSEDEDKDETPFAAMRKKMTQITDDGGVYKSIIKKGTGEIVSPGAICRVHYNGYLEYKDEPFDSTRLRNIQQQIRLGESVLAGFDVAIGTMRKGEVSMYLFSPKYAYKEMGCPPRIPPNETVLFEIELVSFVDQAAVDEFSEFSTEERNKASFESLHYLAQSFRETGNELFKQSEFYRAIKKYDKGIQLLENCRVKDDADEKTLNVALLRLYMNASLCALRLGQGIRAKKYGRKALELDPKNIKAIYRVGQGFQKEGEFRKAREWYLRAQRQEPNNAEIRVALEKLDQDVQRWKISEKKMCKKMFVDVKPVALESAKESVEAEEKTATVISDEVKSLMIERLNNFQDNKEQNDIVFPSTLTISEVNFLVKKAEEMGLHPVPPSKRISYLKITKEKTV